MISISDGISYTTETRLSVPGVEVEVLNFRQPQPYMGVLATARHNISMSLSSQLAYSRGAYIDADGRQAAWTQVGDISFCPSGTRLAVMVPGGAECHRRIYCSFETDGGKFILGQTSGLNGGGGNVNR